MGYESFIGIFYSIALSCGGAEQSRVNWPTDIAEGRQVCTVIYDLLNNASIDSVAGQFGNDISKEKATAMFVQLKELYGHMESYKITSVETEVLSGAVGVQKKITCFIDVVYSKTKMRRGDNYEEQRESLVHIRL
ncbi:MAG: hypothetical protein IPO17_07515 [Flavobacteriales bacterium]|nr:hypothetical protein [Flavobacteriales bacterium]